MAAHFFPIRFRLENSALDGCMQYQFDGRIGNMKVVYAPHPESVLQPSNGHELFLVSLKGTTEEHPTHIVMGVILHEELRPIEEIDAETEVVLPVEKRIKSILAPARTKTMVRTNHRARERSAGAYNKPGASRKSKGKAKA